MVAGGKRRAAALLWLLIGVASHTVDKRMSSFVITGESRDAISVSLPMRKAKCSFDYVAGQPVHENKPVEGTRVRADDVYQRLSGQCARGQSGYWTYEVCIGGNIRQFHGPDSYMLGRFNRVEGKIFKFENGLPCDPPTNPMERKVDVSLACSDVMGLQLISEPSTCVYTMTLVTPEVCSDSSYPKLMSSPGGAGGAPDDGHEEWILQIREANNGAIICSAHTTELKLSGSRLSFSSFSLKMESDSSTISAPYGSARSMGRAPLAKNEISLGGNAITHGPGFNGKLGYVELLGSASSASGGGDPASGPAAASPKSWW